MSQEMNLPPELREVEAALGLISPASPGIDRDRLMYEAGRAVGVHRTAGIGLRCWQGLCGSLALLCLGLMVWKPVQVVDPQSPSSAWVEPVIEVLPVTQPPAAWPLASRGTAIREYLQMRDRALESAAHAPDAMTQPRAGVDEGSHGGIRPLLRWSEGLDALPMWQKQTAVFGAGGDQS